MLTGSTSPRAFFALLLACCVSAAAVAQPLSPPDGSEEIDWFEDAIIDVSVETLTADPPDAAPAPSTDPTTPEAAEEGAAATEVDPAPTPAADENEQPSPENESPPDVTDAGSVQLIEQLMVISRVPTAWQLLPETIRASPDGEQMTYRVVRNNLVALVVDQFRGPACRDLIGPTFSDDGRRLAYLGFSQGRKSWTLFDGHRPHPTKRGLAPPKFGPRGRSLAFLASNGVGRQVIIDRRQSTAYEAVDWDRFTFSPDGEHHAYPVIDAGRWHVIHDGAASPAFDRILGQLAFNADSSRLAFVGWRDGQWFLMVNGEMVGPYRTISQPTFSPNGKRLACWVQREDGQWVIRVDGELRESTRADRPGGLRFSHDSRRLAVQLKRGGHWYVWEDGEISEPWDAMGAGSLRFSYNSRHLAYAGRSSGKWHVVIDGRRGPANDGLLKHSLRFNMTGDRLAYAARLGEKWHVFVDGQPRRGHHAIRADSIIFSFDGDRLGYIAEDTTGRAIVVVDHEQFPAAEDARSLTFSTDSRTAAWLARRDGLWRIVANGIEGQHTWDRWVEGAQLKFESPNDLFVLGYRRRKLEGVRIEATLHRGYPSQQRDLETQPDPGNFVEGDIAQ